MPAPLTLRPKTVLETPKASVQHRLLSSSTSGPRFPANKLPQRAAGSREFTHTTVVGRSLSTSLPPPQQCCWQSPLGSTRGTLPCSSEGASAARLLLGRPTDLPPRFPAAMLLHAGWHHSTAALSEACAPGLEAHRKGLLSRRPAMRVKPEAHLPRPEGLQAKTPARPKQLGQSSQDHNTPEQRER